MVIPGGGSEYLDYRNGGGVRCSGKLDTVHFLFPAGASNPGWTHESEGLAPWHADWIEYLTLDGTAWATKAIGHIHVVRGVTIGFAHYPVGSDMDGDPHHSDETIAFLGWSNERWMCTAWAEQVIGQAAATYAIKFRVWGV